MTGYTSSSRYLCFTNGCLSEKRYNPFATATVSPRGGAEAAVGTCRALSREVKDWHSPHRLSQAYELVAQIEQAGYGDLPVVQAFHADLAATENQVGNTRSDAKSGLALEQFELFFHVFAAHLGIAHGRLNRWCPFLRDMAQIIRDFFQGPAGLARPVCKVVAQIMKGQIGDLLPSSFGGPCF